MQNVHITCATWVPEYSAREQDEKWLARSGTPRCCRHPIWHTKLLGPTVWHYKLLDLRPSTLPGPCYRARTTQSERQTPLGQAWCPSGHPPSACQPPIYPPSLPPRKGSSPVGGTGVLRPSFRDPALGVCQTIASGQEAGCVSVERVIHKKVGHTLDT